MEGRLPAGKREGDGGLHLPEQGRLEVPCERAFSSTEPLAKNVHLHVRTITLAGRLCNCPDVNTCFKVERGGVGAYAGTPPNR